VHATRIWPFLACQKYQRQAFPPGRFLDIPLFLGIPATI